MIPYARGRVRSRKTADVVKEVERLAASGCQEVVLTGIHLSSYGTERKEDGGKSSDAYPGSAPGGGNRKNPSGLSGTADRHGKLCGKPVPSAEDLPSFSSFPAKRLHLHPEADEPSLYGGRI